MRYGFLLIDKPKGPTSHDVVGIVRRTLHEKKVGHLGTLDPLADGLMVLAVGAKALKVVELFMGARKEYIADIECGAVSTTYDLEGVIEEQPRKMGWLPPEDASKIQALLSDHFVGKIKQVPPAFSALHVDGERAYRKAMRGESVELPPREITIHDCTVIEYSYPRITVRVHCDSGTYIRSLAHDLGQTMRCGAYLKSLRRTKVGDWSVEDATSPDEVSFSDIVPLKEILQGFPGVLLTQKQWNEVSHGRVIDGEMDSSQPLVGWYEGLPVVLLEPSLKQVRALKPRKVL